MSHIVYITDEPPTRNDLEYGMSQKVLEQRAKTKKIMQQRLKERDELKQKLSAKPTTGSKKKAKPSIKDKVPTKNNLEFGMSEKVLKERERIKAIKAKRKSQLIGSKGPPPPNELKKAKTDHVKKPPSISKTKSARSVNKKEGKKKKIKEKQSKDEDDKNGTAKVPKRRLSKLKDKGMAAQGVDIYQTELALLKEENVELKKQLKMSEFIKKKYEIAKSENTLFKEQVNVLNEENEALRAEIAALRKKLEENSIKAPEGFDHDDVMDAHDDDGTRNQKIDPALLNGAGGDTANGGAKSGSSSSSSSSSASEESEDEDDDDDKKEENQKKEKEEESDSDSDSDSSSDDNTNKPPTRNQMRKPPSSDDSDSDSDTDDELPPEEEEPDQGESEEVLATTNGDNKENTNGNVDDDEDEDSDDDGAGSASSSSSEAEWEEWEPSQIADWMLSLDNKYKKYEKTLRKKLNEEEMHGSLLGELEQSDLDRFGIKSQKHQKAILIELKKMTKQPLPDDE